VLRTLRQPRYATLSVLMLIVAIVCVAAGTWQIARFEDKRHENDHLRRNDHAPTTSAQRLLPLTGASKHNPGNDAIEFRKIAATGRYNADATTFVRNRTIEDGGAVGYLVVTPLDTAAGTLLVVRGFVPAAGGENPTAPAPPAGQVSIVARLASAETRRDAADQLPHGQVESINPDDQAARLGHPVFRGYAELEKKQPGSAGLKAIPSPDLSNPAGGALEPQHFAYVIQWYLFAVLALAAPFAMARSETRQRPTGEIDDDPEPSEELERAHKLADRYGR
jgi:cytochrome oxidase assembly protein ShyY1